MKSMVHVGWVKCCVRKEGLLGEEGYFDEES